MTDQDPGAHEPPVDHLEEPGLVDLAADLRSGDRDVVTSVNERLERADAVEPTVHAFVPEAGRRERLVAGAAAFAARYPDPEERPPLYGVPVGVKDIFHVDGLPTRAGSFLHSGDGPRERDSSANQTP